MAGLVEQPKNEPCLPGWMSEQNMLAKLCGEVTICMTEGGYWFVGLSIRHCLHSAFTLTQPQRQGRVLC